MKSAPTIKKKMAGIEDQRTTTLVKSIGHPKHGTIFLLLTLLTKPSTSMLLKLSKEQIKIDSMITKIQPQAF